MRILEFTADCQKLRKKSDCDFTGIVAGSVGLLRARFFCSIEWLNCKKAASFWVDGKEYAAVLDEKHSCDIPPEALTGDKFEVSLTGVKPGYKITTNKTKVRQEVL